MLLFVLEHELAITIFMQYKEKTDWDRMVSKKNNLTSSHSVYLFCFKTNDDSNDENCCPPNIPGIMLQHCSLRNAVATVATAHKQHKAWEITANKTCEKKNLSYLLLHTCECMYLLLHTCEWFLQKSDCYATLVFIQLIPPWTYIRKYLKSVPKLLHQYWVTLL